jgi:peptidoglycan/LPS O-acetylase OafA/YrhL
MMGLASSRTVIPASRDHVPWLNGLRGAAAIWVFFSHILLLCGTYIPIFSWGALAVDLFMMLSGYLMTHHYILRQGREPWDNHSTWLAFWTRRIFRIAPLYYLLLFASLWIGPWLGQHREAIAEIWQTSAAQNFRYSDMSMANVLSHVSFAFGMLPEFAIRTPLPDWSIGLEMQFYLAFPLLMLAFWRFGPLRTGMALVAACLLLWWQFAEFFDQFEQPSFLPIKLYVFFIGMWVALSRANGSMKRALLASLLVAGVFSVWERTYVSAVRVLMVAAFFYLMNNATLPSTHLVDRVMEQLRLSLSSSLGTFLGNTAYGVYLIHLLVLIPVAGTLSLYPSYVGANGVLRFAICLLLTAPIVYSLAWMVYRSIELPGILIGKIAVRRLNSVTNMARQL